MSLEGKHVTCCLCNMIFMSKHCKKYYLLFCALKLFPTPDITMLFLHREHVDSRLFKAPKLDSTIKASYNHVIFAQGTCGL